MTVQISQEAQIALRWAFGEYAATDPGIPFDILFASDIPEGDLTKQTLNEVAQSLIREAMQRGTGSRVVLGWLTFKKDGRFGLGVMALRQST